MGIQRIVINNNVTTLSITMPGEIGAPAGWFRIRYILIIYLKEKLHGVEIKSAITQYDFNQVTMMFVDDRDFPNLRKITDR